MTIKDLKNELRLNDYRGDRWAVAMSAFFDLCAVGFEQMDLPHEWLYSVGWGGNHIEPENMFICIPLTDEQILTLGNYLNRLTNMLRNSEHAY